MGKTHKTMRFDEDLWRHAEQAARQTRRSTTEYIEYALQEQLKRDMQAGQVKISDKK